MFTVPFITKFSGSLEYRAAMAPQHARRGLFPRRRCWRATEAPGLAYTRSAVGLGLAGETLAAGLCKTLPHAPVLRVAVNTLVASLTAFPCPSSPLWTSLAGMGVEEGRVSTYVYFQLYLNIRGNKA